MVSSLNLSAVIATTPLITLIFTYPAILPLLFSNSIIILIFLVSLFAIFTAPHRRGHVAALEALIFVPFLTVLYKMLTLVPPSIIRTLLSNFTFAAIPLCLLTVISQFLFYFIAGCILGGFWLAVGAIYAYVRLKIWENEPFQTRQKVDELVENLQNRLNENEIAVAIIDCLTTDTFGALGKMVVQYAVMGYYSVMLPPLLGTDSSARIMPFDILAYAVVVALGTYAMGVLLFQILPGKVQTFIYDAKLSFKWAMICLGELLIWVITTGLIALRFSERSILGESVWMLWPLWKAVLIKGGYDTVLKVLTNNQFERVPNWVKTAMAGCFGWFSLRSGLSVWSGFCDATARFDALHAVM